jgi:hypothetical protein
MDIQSGALIKVRAYGGKELVVYCQEVQGKTVIVTSEQERASAAKEKREPVCIGFPLTDVVEVVEKASSSHTTP